MPTSPRTTAAAPVAGRVLDGNWRHSAACLAEDPELFFPVGTSSLAVLQAEQAKVVCRRCPVVRRCLSWAVDQAVEDGVWGGTSEEERRALRRRQGRRTRASRIG